MTSDHPYLVIDDQGSPLGYHATEAEALKAVLDLGCAERDEHPFIENMAVCRLDKQGKNVEWIWKPPETHSAMISVYCVPSRRVL